MRTFDEFLQSKNEGFEKLRGFMFGWSPEDIELYDRMKQDPELFKLYNQWGGGRTAMYNVMQDSKSSRFGPEGDHASTDYRPTNSGRLPIDAGNYKTSTGSRQGDTESDAAKTKRYTDAENEDRRRKFQSQIDQRELRNRRRIN